MPAKTFSARLAALEALEAEQEAKRLAKHIRARPLSDDDCRILHEQIAQSAIAFNGAGQVVRSWCSADVPAHLDTVLARCNAALASSHLWIRDLDTLSIWVDGFFGDVFTASDADDISEDEVLYEVGRAFYAGGIGMRSSGDFYVSGCPPHLVSYWQRIVERANPIRTARGTVLIPATTVELQLALEMLDRGELRLRDNVQYTHDFWFGGAASGMTTHDPRYPIGERLRKVIDAICFQSQRPLCQSSEEVAEILRDILNDDEQDV